VECHYSAPHDQIKEDAQAVDRGSEPSRYLHTSRADKDWLVSQHRRIEPVPAAVAPNEPTPYAS